MMKIESFTQNSVLVLSLSGKFNIEEVANFEESIGIETLQDIQTIAVDFSNVEYIDSSALGSLIKQMNKSKNINIELVLYNITQSILGIFKLAYLDKFFHIMTEEELKQKYPGVNF